MNRRITLVLVVFISAMMMFTTSSVFYEEDSDALVQQNGISINPDHATLYIRAGSEHSMQFTVDKSGIPDTDKNKTVNWYLNNLDDGTNLISFSDTQDVYTSTGNSVTVYGKVAGSIELVAAIAGTSYIASTVIYVANAPGDPTDVFNFYIQVSPAVYETYVGLMTDLNDAEKEVIKEGAWYTVTSSEVTGAFNAWTAFEKLCSREHWQLDGGSSGWINTFHNLSTYSGEGNSYIYWAQYHRVLNSDSEYSWSFNNTTMGYMTSVDQSYIGLIFWPSPSSGDVPPYPGFPVQ